MKKTPQEQGSDTEDNKGRRMMVRLTKESKNGKTINITTRTKNESKGRREARGVQQTASPYLACPWA